MSGHNPHGHLSQPNSSWNPLQIPSYIPRQPQLAHMSNERPLVRSPLSWHTPTPPEALYSFISANHKNLEINPLLPPFVRGPAPFGSVDLTIQTARNNTTSPRQTSPSPDLLHNKPISCNNLSSSISPNPGVIQTTGSVRDKIPTSNGSNGEVPTTGGLFVRDARQINNDFVKMSNRDQNEISLDENEPVQLVKDATYHSVKIRPVSTSPKKSPIQKPPSVPGNAPTPPQPKSPVLPSQNANAAVEVLNHFASIMPVKSANITNEISPICSAKSSPTNTTSNEDSVDSIACKVRRKRKPNKTARVLNDSDESLSVNEQNPGLQIKLDPKNKYLDEILAEKTDCDFKNYNKEEFTNCEIDKEALNFSEQMLISENKNVQNGPSTELKSVKNDQVDFTKNDNSSVIVDNRSHTEMGLPDEKQEVVAENNASCNEELDKQSVSDPQSPRKRSKRKGDSDDIETIDKIAAMIANTNENDSITNCTLQNIDQCQNDNEKIETQQNNTIKANDLTEILGEPVPKEDFTSQNNVEITTENYYEEVENKLEEMFAGIEDERPPCMEEAPVIDSVERQVSPTANCDLGLEIPLVNKIVNQVKLPSQKRTHSSNLDQSPPKKKMKTTKKCNNQKHCPKPKVSPKSVILIEKKFKPREDLDTKYKGPLIHIKSDGLMTVINAPITEDEVDKNNKVKKIFHNHCNTERNKIRGLHISTLSTKYDADTTDISWKCVFCKKGPHKLGLGDLFGPYIITTTCEEFDLSQKDPSEDEFISKRTKAEMFQKHSNRMPVVPAGATLNFHCNLNNMKKIKKPDPSNDVNRDLEESLELPEIFFGMSKVSDTSYEVWMHEDCAVWASGIHLVGARIVGLEAAVWSSTRQKCKICSYNGAVICCLQHGCSEKAHIPCARAESWSVIEEDFKIFCNNHSVLVS